MLTCNDKWRVDQHMRNRPGRIFYLIDFKGLDAEFITEYCTDNLDAKEHIPRICQMASLFGEFNFDMLKAVVEEMNRYGESPSDAMRILNAKPEFDAGSQFSISLTKGGQTVKVNDKFRGNPLSRTVEFWYDLDPEDADSDNANVTVTANDLVSLDGKTGTFTFAQDDVIVVLTRIVEKTPYYFDAF
jgi:hypothetical protein